MSVFSSVAWVSFNNLSVLNIFNISQSFTLCVLKGAIRDAEMLTAEAFGAAKTWLLANGR